MVRMPFGRLEQIEAELPRQPLDRGHCSVPVERHPATEESLRIDAAEDDVGVADRRFRAALPVARRTGGGARAPWADAERAALVDVRDRAAAGADRVHVEHRHEERVATDPRVARRGLGDPGLGHDPDVGRGAAHVEGDQPAPP